MSPYLSPLIFAVSFPFKIDLQFRIIPNKNSIMKKVFLTVIIPIMMFVVVGTTKQAIAQKAEIEKRLTELGIETDMAFNNLSENSTDYSCKATMTETTSEKTTVETASFNPLNAQGSRWTLNTVNGESPSKKDIKKFNKAHNAKQDNLKAEPDENSMKIVNEDDHMFVIGLKYNEADLPHKYKFLGQCNAEIYVDKEAKRLYKVKFYNTTPLKIKGINVVKLDMTIELMLADDGKAVLIKDETIIMDVKLLGQMIEITEETEFYDYEKVK